MNILAIGNSFSQDATRYIHSIARADGMQLSVANLYIGGCSLERHFRNMHSGEKVYDLEYNGQQTGFKVSMKEALLNRKWDVITLQQCSPTCYEADSYYPYITALAEYVRTFQPKAKLLIHQTWSYEENSQRLITHAKGQTAREMLDGLVAANANAAKAINADGIIPSGEMLWRLHEKGFAPIHRDTFHLGKGIPRYAVGLLWYRLLTGNGVLENTFCDLDTETTSEEIRLAKEVVETFRPL